MTKKKETKRITSQMQIQIIGDLYQEAVAALIGRSVAFVRSNAIPRNKAGRFSGPEVVAWLIAETKRELVKDKEDDELAPSGSWKE